MPPVSELTQSLAPSDVDGDGAVDLVAGSRAATGWDRPAESHR